MSEHIQKILPSDFPQSLNEIPEPPKQIYIKGNLPNPTQYYYLAVVGSRKYTAYGREAAERIVSGLTGYPICIVSGLAVGIDGIAHRAALDAKLPTVAIPGSGLDSSVLYPRAHKNLARDIVESGSALLSEYEPMLRAAPWTFPQRNRLMAGLSQSVLIIEAEEQSGTLITARLALDYNKNVFTIPGSIFSATSKGTNKLIKQGATPVTNATELLEELGFIEQQIGVLDLTLYTPEEQSIIVLLDEPLTREEILSLSPLSSSQTLSTLTILEIKGLVREKMGKIERV